MRRTPTACTSMMALAGMLLSAGLAAHAAPERIQDNPFLSLSSPTSWDFRRKVRIAPSTLTYRGPSGQRATVTDRIVLSELTVVAPLNEGCATALTPTDRLAQAGLEIDQKVVSKKPSLLPGFQCGEQLGRWDTTNIDTRRIDLEIKGTATTYHTRIDERAATQVPWPENGFPETIATALDPQPFIQSDDPAIVALMNRWTSNNPQGPNPYLVAKALAGQVQQSFQPSGSGQRRDYPARWAGVTLKGASACVKSMKGTDSDMAALLCAIYRAAGLPARVVVGLDVAGSPGGRSNVPAPIAVCRANFDPDGITHALLRTWVEFYLYDEANDRGGWIPVDIQMLRLSSNRMQSLDRAWDGFGGGMCYDHLIPITFHFTPPMTVGEDPLPALWGWLPTPSDATCETELIIEAAPAVQRGGGR